MASDYIIDDMEEQYRQNLFIENMRQAAIHILQNGMGESAAVQYMEDIQLRRDQAKAKGEYVPDIDGHVDYFLDSELNTPSTEGMNLNQIYAIQQKLLNKYGY
ncbi:hypothetical protein ONF77_004030 [Vibrio parahaemolyticus]|nr:hypothetical protein [Vibrio parahaemolyticus]EME0846905.1 hypothetical protein [Vibrio parahaemolyticus]HBC3388391.1 hypothetical protein [Vibrio parahaemolyticus]